MFAIASGFYDMVLVGGVEEMSKCTTETVAEGLALAAVPYENKVGFTFPGVFGTIATAYFEKYGATHQNLMDVTIKSHNNAPLNPKAQFPYSIRDLMERRIEKARIQGEPFPEWRNEKEFLADSRINPPIAGYTVWRAMRSTGRIPSNSAHFPWHAREDSNPQPSG